jgi:hypothetical protein
VDAGKSVSANVAEIESPFPALHTVYLMNRLLCRPSATSASYSEIQGSVSGAGCTSSNPLATAKCSKYEGENSNH